MRISRKIIASIAAVAALFSASLGSVPASQAALSQQQKDQLNARRAQLVGQLQALILVEHGASSNLLSAEGQYLTAQDGVNAVRAQLDATNAKLTDLQQRIAAEEKRDADAQRQLAQLTRTAYETAGDRSLIATVLSSSDFGQAMQRMKSADSVAGDVAQLEAQLAADQASVAQERADLQVQFAKATDLEKQLSDQSNRFLAAVATRNVELSTASQPVRNLEAQIADIDNQLAADAAPPVVNTGGPGGSCNNRFAYGQCTWYVASRRCVPWSGNANQWFYNAAAMGYLEGHQPAVGAVVVFWPGGDGASGVGHVGYVEAVGPASGVPGGQFRLSEMNFGGWGRINYRNLPNNSRGIQGFIYGHG